jgi:hypothetical protein
LLLLIISIERVSLAGHCFCSGSEREATLSEFEGAAPKSPVVDATKATARLPRLDIEIFHRRSPKGDSEQISIVLQAAPSFEAFGRFIEATNPFAFWAQAAWLTWFPWLEATRAMMLPWNATLPLTKSDAGDPEHQLPSS